jgi:hypothetical protein
MVSYFQNPRTYKTVGTDPKKNTPFREVESVPLEKATKLSEYGYVRVTADGRCAVERGKLSMCESEASFHCVHKSPTLVHHKDDMSSTLLGYSLERCG